MLERNPELEFQDAVDLDRLVTDAFADFQKDRSSLDGSEKQVRADQICESFLVQLMLSNVWIILHYYSMV